ncbi:hypothetical protein B0I35DRAFT_420835 [Stachybotrys elegans]|uniref:Reverse transcriptase domain-containing protein n=1 Tax=Stachybotrys elegans TaxID=80388 RepID=A0A8K0WUI0_9HYPO|nr:hypothetical protein B0I35DRAFT_420835 [Stachybotrys elegans]
MTDISSSGSVFSQTLKEITNTKLEELSKSCQSFEQAKASLLIAIQAEEDPVARLRVLSSGMKSCFAIKVDKAGNVKTDHTALPQLEIELKNLDRFLNQAEYDPSLSSKTLEMWEKSLLQHLETQSLRFRYASIYGQLVTEWLSDKSKSTDVASEDVQMGETFEDLGSAQRLVARESWEKLVFDPAKVDEAKLWNHLHSIFGLGDESKKDISGALQQIQNSVYAFEETLSQPNQFNNWSLKWVIRGLTTSDLLSDEKREVLKDFEGNEVLLNEIADVLNMRLNALSSWTWSSDSSVPVALKRRINGTFDIHMHEDLLQTIFLQYLGVKWSVFFKREFESFRTRSGTWKSAHKNIPKLDKQRLGYYLGSFTKSPCLHTVRARIYNKKYFMAQLMNDEQQATQKMEGEEEVEVRAEADSVGASLKRSRKAPRRQLASKAARKSVPSTAPIIAFRDEEAGFDDETDLEDGEDDGNFNPMELKQKILHLLSAEMTINKRLYGEMSAFHSVFESWDTLLPHGTILTVLKFLGVSQDWLHFFTKFLEAPLRFMDDDADAPVRKRRRGTPVHHVLSDVVGEATLFCLDFAVNQATDGQVLWRVRDDVWFWSRDHAAVVKAWQTISTFNSVAGTRMNLSKTGTVRVAEDQNVSLPIDKSLPHGDIRWGFLKLSPATGEFQIDQAMVDDHIAELREQLKSKHGSILGFIHAWNTFAGTFFASNFGKAAECFGRKHVDNMLSMHRHIQRQIFNEEGISSVADYLKTALERRFGLTDVPDGYLYFPMEMGGLDLRSPFVSLLQIRDELTKSPTDFVDEFRAAERKAYDEAHEAFVNGDTARERYALDDPDWEPESAHERDNFFSFEEYTRHRESFLHDRQLSGSRLHDVFHRLMRRPQERSVDPDRTKVSVAITQLRVTNQKGITQNWYQMDAYWRWVAMMYGPEVLDRFGSLNIVDSGSLPMGMVSFFRGKRITWQG